MNPEYRLAELERRLWNLLRLGVVAEADYAGALVRVRSGDLLTGWIPWLTRRASNDADWWAPEVGEQVVLLSPGGEPEQAVALPALYQSAHSAPAAIEYVRRVTYADGTTVEYDRDAHILKVYCVGDIQVRAAGDVKLSVDGSVTANVSGNVTADIDGDVALTSGGRLDVEAAAVKFDVDGRFEVTASNITIGNTVKDGNGRDSTSHTHSGVQSGSGSTGPAQ